MALPILTAAGSLLSNKETQKKLTELLGKAFKGVGGVTQDRFFDRYFEIKEIFNKGGYPVKGSTHDALLTKHRIRKTQVKDRKSSNYQEEFDRLHAWMVEMLNIYNPGLGDYWKAIQPSTMTGRHRLYKFIH